MTGGRGKRLDTDLGCTPSEDLSRGRYENALVETLGNLRVRLRRQTGAHVAGVGRLDLPAVRVTLDLIRSAQRQLNATGHHQFLLV